MFTLIELPYAADALEPIISARTLSFHHGKHLQAYVDNLNKLLPGTPYENLPLEEIVRTATAGPLFNNAGQILNHNLYFTQFKAPSVVPGQTGHPDNVILSEAKNLIAQIERQWGTLAAFQADFEAKGASLFGSGWVWLAGAPDGTLQITQEPGAGNPVTRGLKPLLTFDVWEHAYYLDYQNRRAAHLSALWPLVNWDEIESRYQK